MGRVRWNLRVVKFESGSGREAESGDDPIWVRLSVSPCLSSPGDLCLEGGSWLFGSCVSVLKMGGRVEHSKGGSTLAFCRPCRFPKWAQIRRANVLPLGCPGVNL